jgi:dTDP-4-amino-4,6-dideoxygalactose transaminase
MKISFLDLKAQYESIKPEIDEAIKKVVDSQIFILGKELEEFEKEFAKYLGAKYVVGVNSGTDALILSLLALGIGKGDEVITPVNSFIATTTAITQVGATPVFVDCDPDTYQINVKEVEKKITKKTKAILPVHLYGAPAEIEELQEIVKRNSLFLVEDAAQAHGSTFNNQKLGSFGDLGAFSFYPGKNLGAYGDGGAIATNNSELYEKLLKLRNYGQSKKYFHDSFGLNSRLDEIQAAVLRVKLKHLDMWNEKRREIVKLYSDGLKNVKTQKIIDGGQSNYYIFSIESDKRAQLQEYLSKQGIETLIHYPIPIHLQKANKHLGYRKGDFPVAEMNAEECLSLPVYPELKAENVKYICQVINKFYSR